MRPWIEASVDRVVGAQLPVVGSRHARRVARPRLVRPADGVRQRHVPANRSLRRPVAGSLSTEGRRERRGENEAPQQGSRTRHRNTPLRKRCLNTRSRKSQRTGPTKSVIASPFWTRAARRDSRKAAIVLLAGDGRVVAASCGHWSNCTSARVMWGLDPGPTTPRSPKAGRRFESCRRRSGHADSRDWLSSFWPPQAGGPSPRWGAPAGAGAQRTERVHATGDAVAQQRHSVTGPDTLDNPLF